MIVNALEFLGPKTKVAVIERSYEEIYGISVGPMNNSINSMSFGVLYSPAGFTLECVWLGDDGLPKGLKKDGFLTARDYKIIFELVDSGFTLDEVFQFLEL